LKVFEQRGEFTVKRFAGWAFAFCTLLTAIVTIGWATTAPPKLGENFASYNRARVQWGATALPLGAQITYNAATYAFGTGDFDGAKALLRESLELDPGFPDAYFTLSKIAVRQFDANALYFAVQGIRALSARFHNQSLLAVNGLLIAVLLLLILTTVVCVTFASRYLPFLAHKIAESLEEKFNAALPKGAAFLIILMPFALLPGFVSGVCMIVVMTWYFMQKRERFMTALLIAPFVLLGIFAPRIKQFNPLADPSSFTHMASRAMYWSGDPTLIKAVEKASVPGLEAEKHNVLGLLHYRQENYDTAAWHFLRAIELDSQDLMAYVNLGNVYYSQGMYEKALEGYRKAAQIDDSDAAGQYNLAQAYIKTLLMAESSIALNKAADGGIDDIKETYAHMALPMAQIYPKTFTNGDLWRIAMLEGGTHESDFISEMLQPLLRMPTHTCAWLLLGALLFAVILTPLFRKKNLTFQCSNCGELTCDNCCEDTGGTYLCDSCAGVIDGVSSDKVVEALLRQRRQGVLVRRRKAIRVLTLWLPGMRDIYYGRLTRGLFLTLIFALSVIELWTRGFLVKDWNSLVTSVSMWKWVLPAAGIVVAYASTVLSKRYLEVRNYRSPSIRALKKDKGKDDGFGTNSVTA
jgi:tetratricopeptide (TPR) repeat protein